MKQLARALTVPLVFVTAFLLFGAPGAPAVSHLPSMGEAQAVPGCGRGRVSLACASYCTTWKRCMMTGGGADPCEEEWKALIDCINISEVRVVAVRVVRRMPLALVRASYSGFQIRWSDLWNTWYVQLAPPPPPRNRTLVGKCSRPVEVFTLPASVPDVFRAWIHRNVVQHHDVRTRKIADGTTIETTRGFFAVDMTEAVLAAAAWAFYRKENDGFVDAEVRDSATTAGSCNLSRVTVSTYDRVLANITAPNTERYHLVEYNCQHWAAAKSGR